MSGTTGTARTQSFLLTNEFQDGQITGSITPQDMRDLVVSTYPNAYNVVNYGADPTNVASSTTAFAAAITAATAGGGVVFIPTGTFKVSCGTLTVPSNVAIVGSGRGSVIAVPSGSTGFLFSTTSTTNVSFDYFKVTSANDATFVVKASTVTILSVSRIYAVGPVLLSTTTTAGDVYANVNDGNSNFDITVKDNVGQAVAHAVNTNSFIELQWVQRGIVSGNLIRGIDDYYNGIWWWGGDANFAVDGALANARKTKNLLIENNEVYNVQSGIAGSMGQNIQVVGNEVRVCVDVGIDCEGCFESTVVGNASWDATNGALTIFFGNRNMMAVGNTLGNTASNVVFQIFNSNVDNLSSDGLTLRDNTFISLSGLGAVSDASGPCGNTIVEDNTFINTNVTFNNNSAGVTIRNNRFHYTATLAAHSTINLYCLSANETTNTIQGNTVMCEAAQNAATIFINLLSNDFNLPVTYVVEENKNCGVNPLPKDIVTTEQGTNAGVSGQFFIRNNMLTGATHYTRTESGSKVSFVRWEGNYDGSMIPYPVVVGTNVGDANSSPAIVAGSKVIIYSTTLTANRTVTLPTQDVYNGSILKVVRTGLGAFTLAVGAAKTIPSATAAWCEVTYNGSAWIETGFGTL